jgi:hypothetical protein
MRRYASAICLIVRALLLTGYGASAFVATVGSRLEEPQADSRYPASPDATATSIKALAARWSPAGVRRESPETAHQ